MLGVGVAGLGVLLSLFLAYQQSLSVEQADRERMTMAGKKVSEALVRRIDAYTEIAFGLRGLFVADPLTTRKAFVQAVESLDVETRYPCIKNIAFTRYVTRDQKQSFERQVRADTSLEARGYPEFVIRPPGQRDEYFVADYLWPTSSSKLVHGLDISAQPANLASMRFAMATGKPTASAPFDLIQEQTEKTGFVVRVPVFDPSKGVQYPSGGGSKFLGSVAVTLRTYDLFASLNREGVLNGLRVSLSDQGSSLPNAPKNQERMLFSSLEQGKTQVSEYSDQLSVYGRIWKIKVQPVASYLSDAERQAPLLLSIAGSTISILLGLMVGFLRRDKFRALKQISVASEALQDSERRYGNLVANLHIGILLQSPTSEIILSNDSALNLLGVTREQLMGMTSMDPSWNVIHEDGSAFPGAQHPVPQAIATRTSVHGAIMGVFRPATKDRVWLMVDAHPRLQEDGAVRDVVCTLTDVTESRRSQQQMRTLSRIIEQAPMSIVITDLAGSIEYVNPWVSTVTGYNAQEILGKNPRVLQAGLTSPKVYQDLWNTLMAGGVWRGEFHNRKRSGEVLVEQAVVAPVLDPDGKVTHYVALKEDITERKKTEASLREHAEQLRALSRRVLEVQEAERRRLAVELHDELGQLLTAIKINLQSNERFRSQAPDELNVENIRIVEDALQQVRRLALALRPSMLDDLGLAPALRWMAEQNAQRSGFAVQLYTDRLHDRLAPDIEIACFRIVQEALTNIVRYAQAKHVKISLLEEGSMLVLVVTDDGCGFDVAAMKAGALAGGSMGVLGMQERAALIGGQLDIQSTPGAGSTLRMQCPMRLRGDAT